MFRGVWWCLLLLLPGCTVDELDPTGKNCPCPTDFVCEKASQTCVRTANGPGPGSSGSGTTSTGGGGAGSCSDVCGTPNCGTCPPTNVVDIDAYDIDATEVTLGNYKAFLDANPSIANQEPLCGWNTTFEPLQDASDMMGCDGPFDFITFPNHPMSCMDWCDASAYCAWAGRRLCGRIGGGMLLQEQAADPDLDEWHRACTNAGALAYPYGNTFEETTCNTGNSGFGALLIDVGVAVDCEGGYTGLFDMSGNVEEWEDVCGTGPNGDDPSDDSCWVRGGAFWTNATESACDSLVYGARRNWASHDWGFRCCGPAR